eukprot:gene266-275_t
MDPQVPALDLQKLPLRVYKMEIDSNSSCNFAKVPFQLETAPAERVAIDEIVKSAPEREGASALEAHSLTMATSLSQLLSKIGLIVEQLKRMHEGKVPMDCALLRSVNSICQQLSASGTADFSTALKQTVTDSALTAYLASVSKNLLALKELASSSTMAHGMAASSSAWGHTDG